MKRSFLSLILSSVCVAVAAVSCRSTQVSDIPRGNDLMSAAGYVFELMEQGKLPGVNKDEHGTFKSVPVKYSETEPARLLDLTVRLTVNERKNVVYWYDLQRPDETARWQLAKAWQTDASGENRVELLVNDK